MVDRGHYMVGRGHLSFLFFFFFFPKVEEIFKS
jgi:hypothetical protein